MDAGLREKAQNVSFIAAAVGLVVGLVLACYASYLEHTTGATILEQPVVEGQSILMDLDPEMNPVHLRWSGQVGSSRRWREALFGASLKLGDRAIWNGEVSMWARRAARSTPARRPLKRASGPRQDGRASSTSLPTAW